MGGSVRITGASGGADEALPPPRGVALLLLAARVLVVWVQFLSLWQKKCVLLLVPRLTSKIPLPRQGSR